MTVHRVCSFRLPAKSQTNKQTELEGMYDMKCLDLQESVMSYCTKSFESIFCYCQRKKQGQGQAVLHLHIYCKSHYYSLLSKAHGLSHHSQSIPKSPPLHPVIPTKRSINEMCFPNLWEWPGYLILATVTEVIRGWWGVHNGNFRKGHLHNEEH